jgi:hypothetical protein
VPRDKEILIKIKAKADEAKQALEEISRHAGKIGDKFGHAFKVASALTAASLATVGATAAALGKRMLSGAGEVERYASILETVTGSAEIAAQKLAWLREFAAKTPFELPGLMEAATKLEAYGFSAEKYMRVLGDTSAALGKDVMSAVEALADATTGEFERLKEFGIRASVEGAQVAFEYVDQSGKQQRAVVDKNNREMIASTLTAIWNDRYGGAMEKMSQTWEGMVSNMRDAFTKAMADAGQKLLPAFKPVLEELIGFLEGEEFLDIIQSLGGTLANMAPVALELFQAAKPLVGVVGQLVDKLSPIFLDLARHLVDVLGRAAEVLAKSGIVDSLARIVEAVGGEFIDTLDRLLKLAIPIIDQTLKVVTPLIEIADKLGIIQGIIYAIIVKNVISGVSSLFSTITNLATSLQNLGPAAASGAAQLSTSLSGAISGLSAPLSATAASLGTTIGVALVSGLMGYIIGSQIGNWIAQELNKAAEIEIDAMRREEDTQRRLAQVIAERQRKLTEAAEAHRDKIAGLRQEYDALVQQYMAFAPKEWAEKLGVVALTDAGVAIEYLAARMAQLNNVAQQTEDVQLAAKFREQAKLAGAALLELQAKTGILKDQAQEAASRLAELPDSVITALKSANPQVHAAAVEAMGAYLQGLASAGNLPPEKAAEIARMTAQALSSSDPEVRRRAYETICNMANSLVAAGVITQETADSLSRRIAVALGLSETEINGVQSTYSNAIRRVGAIFASKEAAAAQELARRFKNTIKRLIRLEDSPAVDVWAPRLYREALEGIRNELERGGRAIAGITESRVAIPLRGALQPTVAGQTPAASAGPEVIVNIHIGTLVSDDAAWEELARKIQFHYGPRLARAAVMT